MNKELSTLKLILGADDSEYELLDAIIDANSKRIISRVYELVGEPEDAVVPYEYRQVLIDACVLEYNMRGAEGQVSHNENGISRGYKYGDASSFIKASVCPYAR